MSGPSLQTYVLVYRPSDFQAGWEKTETFEAAKHLQRAHVIVDPDGREARLFGGFTSGQTFLYDGDGALRFSGGITGSRSHAGDNAGRRSLVALLSGEAPDRTATNVFGCPLFTSGL